MFKIDNSPEYQVNKKLVEKYVLSYEKGIITKAELVYQLAQLLTEAKK